MEFSIFTCHWKDRICNIHPCPCLILQSYFQAVTNSAECPADQPHHRWDQRCQSGSEVSLKREYLVLSNGSEGVCWLSGVVIAVINILL